jgi:hypothetical protein
MTNRRKHRRIVLAATATLTFGGDSDLQSVQTMIADISLCGVGVYSDNLIKEDTDLSIEIHFISLGGIMRSDSMRGRSVYARKIRNIYFIGIEFDSEINAAGQPFLYEHLQGILQWG